MKFGIFTGLEKFSTRNINKKAFLLEERFYYGRVKTIQKFTRIVVELNSLERGTRQRR